MKLNSQKFSVSVSLVSGGAYLICSAFVAFWPGLSLKLMAWLFHAPNMEQLGIYRITPIGVIGGLVQVLIYMYVVAALFSWLFNKSIKEQ